MSELDDKPYILCPEFPGGEIRVTPLWFIPQGGGPEGPVVVLENVPVGFHSVLEVCGFVQRGTGWLVVAEGKTEEFWRKIFSNVGFVQRKPASLYKPQRIIFHPPPPEVKAVVANFSDEHLTYLTKPAGLVGLDAVRAARKDAERGAVNCRGAWPLIKAACLERLTKNPEDVRTFEYVWATARAVDLDTSGVPATISHRLLLQKIVERRRMTAQMERVVPTWYRTPSPGSFVLKASWLDRKIYSGASTAGPVDVLGFDDVDGMAQYLLDEEAGVLQNSSVEASFQARIQAQHQDFPGGSEEDWVDNLQMPETAEDPVAESEEVSTGPSEPEVESVRAEATPAPTEQEQLSWDRIYNRLRALHDLAESRVAFSRVLCRQVINMVIFGRNVPIDRPGLIGQLESLVGLFAAVINTETLEKVWEHNGDRVRALCETIGDSAALRMNLLKVLRSPQEARKLAETKLMESQGEDMGWWWTGFACATTPSGKEWALYRIRSARSERLPGQVYDGPEQASEALHYYARSQRLACMRRGFDVPTWFHGYRTTSGAILRLGLEEYASEEEAKAALEHQQHAYLSVLQMPVVWEQEPIPLGVSETERLIMQMLEGLNLSDRLSHLNGLLEWGLVDGQTHAFYDGLDLGPVGPGHVAHAWAGALYLYCQVAMPDRLEQLITDLVSGEAAADLDISIEDDLLEELEQHTETIEREFGPDAIDDLEGAITGPSAEAEHRCRQRVLAIREAEGPADLEAFLRSVLLVSAQHRPHATLSEVYREKLRLGCSTQHLFQFAFAQFVWLRLRWAGLDDPRLSAGGIGGDTPAGEVYPRGAPLWRLHSHFQLLAEALSEQLEGVERDRPMISWAS